MTGRRPVNNNDIYAVCLQVIEAFERLNVPYHIGGSLASMAHGVPRSTLDADLVAALKPDQVEAFAGLLGPDFIINEEAMKASLSKSRSNNIIHKGSLLKVDIYPVQDTPFARVESSRRVLKDLPGCPGRQVWCCSAEDIVLRKLSWFREGGEVARRQWEDAVQVLRVQKPVLDFGYLIRWAGSLNVEGLLKKAIEESGGTAP